MLQNDESCVVSQINCKAAAIKLADEARDLAYRFILSPRGSMQDLTELDLEGVMLAVATRAADNHLVADDLYLKVCEELLQIIAGGHPSLKMTPSLLAVQADIKSRN